MLLVDRRNRRADLVWAKALRILPQGTYAQTRLTHASIRIKTSFQVMRPAKTVTILTLKSQQGSRRTHLLT